MGKKKDKKKLSNLDYYLGNKKLNKALDRYGVEKASFGGKPGNYGSAEARGVRTVEDVNKELSKAAMQDYDTRRTLEAAGLSGNKKAAKMSAKGFKDADSVLEAQKFFEKKHKNARGLGGSFSSASDFAGLTDYYVNKDRENLLASMGDKEPDTPLEKAKESFKTGFDKGLSPKAATAFGYTDAFEDRADGLTDYSMTDVRFGDEATQDAAAEEFAELFKEKVKGRLSPTFRMDKIFTED